jgi:hypothetical protein
MKMIIEVGPLTRNEIDAVLFQIDESCSSLQLTEDEAKWATTLIESARDALFKWEVPTAEPVDRAEQAEAALAVAENWVEHHSQHADDLIAVNTDLLIALKRLVGDHADLGEVDLVAEERDALDFARAAIAKAEGRA